MQQHEYGAKWQVELDIKKRAVNDETRTEWRVDSCYSALDNCSLLPYLTFYSDFFQEIFKCWFNFFKL
jgi:hypothetical protein